MHIKLKRSLSPTQTISLVVRPMLLLMFTRTIKLNLASRAPIKIDVLSPNESHLIITENTTFHELDILVTFFIAILIVSLAPQTQSNKGSMKLILLIENNVGNLRTNCEIEVITPNQLYSKVVMLAIKKGHAFQTKLATET
jgi:hypothetical protein